MHFPTFAIVKPRSLRARFLWFAVSGASVFASFAGVVSYEFAYRQTVTAGKVAINSLIDAVERTAAVGAYARDQVLLKEVVDGLARSGWTDGILVTTLDGRPIIATAASPWRSVAGLTIERRLMAPFSRAGQSPAQIAIMRVRINADHLGMVARANALALAAAIISEALLLTLVLYAAADKLVSRPITTLAARLRELVPGTVKRLRIPRLHSEDEIGRLIASVNTMLESNEQFIIELRRTHARLAARQHAMESAAQLSPNGLVVIDIRGHIILVNQSFQRLTGIDAESLVGATANELQSLLRDITTSEKNAGGLPSDVDRWLQATGMLETSQYMLHLQQPEPKALLVGERGGGVGEETVLHFRDVTREIEVDRMKSDFLSNAAHELRTPLTSVLGFTELLLQQGVPPDDQRDILLIIHERSVQLVKMINDILDLTHIEQRRSTDFELSITPIQEIIRTTVARLPLRIDNRKLEIEVPEQPVWVEVDSKRLAMALTNVLSNAFQYSSSGSVKISVSLSKHVDQQSVGICVKDAGIGMSQSELDRLFERFFRADRTGSTAGTGLGTNLVKEIIDLHRGHIEVHSSVGDGTNFTLWLPVVAMNHRRSVRK